MLPRLDAGATPITPVARPEAAAALGDTRQEAFQRSLRTMLGQPLRGEVLSRLTDGSFLVRVAGTAARMMLPPEARVGGEVPLTLLSVDPRPTFRVGDGRPGQGGVTVALAYPEAGEPDVTVTLAHTVAEAELAAPLARGPGVAAAPARNPAAAGEPADANAPGAGAARNAAPGAEPARAGAAGVGAAGVGAAGVGAAGVGVPAAAPLSPAAILLSKAPLTPASQLPGFDPSAPPPALSQAARAIASVVTQAESRPGAPQAIAGKTALMADPARTGTAQLAQTLHEAIGHSGLFYESHVAEWAAGRRTLPELQQEPQMRQAGTTPTATTTPAMSAPTSAAAAPTDAAPAMQATPAALAAPAPPATESMAAATAATPAPAVPADPSLASAQLINLQLHVQEQSRVQWQGEAWPGQKMEWDIEREAGGDGEAAQPTLWRSNVRFEFAGLGTVSAALLMVGGALQLDLRAASPDSAGALRAQAGALEQALAAAGAPLSALAIGLCQDEEAAADGL